MLYSFDEDFGLFFEVALYIRELGYGSEAQHRKAMEHSTVHHSFLPRQVPALGAIPCCYCYWFGWHGGGRGGQCVLLPLLGAAFAFGGGGGFVCCCCCNLELCPASSVCVLCCAALPCGAERRFGMFCLAVQTDPVLVLGLAPV